MLLFDMDGTLIDSNGVWKNVDREFLARRGIAYTHAYYEGVAHTILPLAAKFTKEYCRLTESCEEIIAEWMEMARDAYAHVTVKPGVRAYLKQCRAEGRRMAVVTSSVPEHCRTALTHLDLMKYFEGVTLAQDLPGEAEKLGREDTADRALQRQQRGAGGGDVPHDGLPDGGRAGGAGEVTGSVRAA